MANGNNLQRRRREAELLLQQAGQIQPRTQPTQAVTPEAATLALQQQQLARPVPRVRPNLRTRDLGRERPVSPGPVTTAPARGVSPDQPRRIVRTGSDVETAGQGFRDIALSAIPVPGLKALSLGGAGAVAAGMRLLKKTPAEVAQGQGRATAAKLRARAARQEVIRERRRERKLARRRQEFLEKADPERAAKKQTRDEQIDAIFGDTDKVAAELRQAGKPGSKAFEDAQIDFFRRAKEARKITLAQSSKKAQRIDRARASRFKQKQAGKTDDLGASVLAEMRTPIGRAKTRAFLKNQKQREVLAQQLVQRAQETRGGLGARKLAGGGRSLPDVRERVLERQQARSRAANRANRRRQLLRKNR